MIKLRKFKKLIKIIKKFKHVKSLLKCLTFKSLQLMTTVDRFCLLVSFMHSLGLIKDQALEKKIVQSPDDFRFCSADSNSIDYKSLLTARLVPKRSAFYADLMDLG